MSLGKNRFFLTSHSGIVLLLFLVPSLLEQAIGSRAPITLQTNRHYWLQECQMQPPLRYVRRSNRFLSRVIKSKQCGSHIYFCGRPHHCCTLVFAKRIVRMSSAQICDIRCCFLQAYKIGAEVVVESTPAKCKAELTKDGGDYDAATMVRESLYFNIYIYNIATSLPAVFHPCFPRL